MFRLFLAFFAFTLVACLKVPYLKHTSHSEYSRVSEETSRKAGSRSGRTDQAGDCSEDRSCKGICSEIFSSQSDYDDCLEFSVPDVEEFEEIRKILKKAKTKELEEIDEELLAELVEINLGQVLDIIEDAKRLNFIKWMAKDDDIADIIEGADDEEPHLICNLLEGYPGSGSGISREDWNNIASSLSTVPAAKEYLKTCTVNRPTI